jgi:CheY-like chemotaxis protein
MTGILHGKRILLVEDEYLICLLAADMLEELGAVPVGPAGTVLEALQLIEREQIDAAMLDVNLGKERSDPVAEQLRARGIPFVLASGYGSVLGPETREPIVGKPYDIARVEAALSSVLA